VLAALAVPDKAIRPAAVMAAATPSGRAARANDRTRRTLSSIIVAPFVAG
jgi:hypothetical protein